MKEKREMVAMKGKREDMKRDKRLGRGGRSEEKIWRKTGGELDQLNTGREETKRREKIKRKKKRWEVHVCITCRSEECPGGVGSGGRPAGTSTAVGHRSEPAHIHH